MEPDSIQDRLHLALNDEVGIAAVRRGGMSVARNCKPEMAQMLCSRPNDYVLTRPKQFDYREG